MAIDELTAIYQRDLTEACGLLVGWMFCDGDEARGIVASLTEEFLERQRIKLSQPHKD